MVTTIIELLTKQEDCRLVVYDDATGKPLKKGKTLKGNPTIGTGRNLASPGLSQGECDMLLANDIADRRADLSRALPWFKGLSEVRQAVLISMAFMGTAKLLKFKNMLAALSESDYKRAADQMIKSKWASQVKGRAVELANMMVNDTWPAS